MSFFVFVLGVAAILIWLQSMATEDRNCNMGVEKEVKRSRLSKVLKALRVSEKAYLEFQLRRAIQNAVFLLQLKGVDFGFKDFRIQVSGVHSHGLAKEMNEQNYKYLKRLNRGGGKGVGLKNDERRLTKSEFVGVSVVRPRLLE